MPDAPTPALLAAILRKIPESLAPLAWAAYVYGSVARMDLDEATHGALWTRLPAIEPEPGRRPNLRTDRTARPHGRDMSDAKIVVEAQWALYGKATGASGDRVLACSAGDLAVANFADAISRFQLGALPELPQVSVSYAQPVKSGRSFLALAIHKAAGQGQLALDDAGRPVTYTNYFCLPYGPLAASGVTYQAIHEALRDLRLPAAPGATLRVTIAVPPWQPPVIDPLALRVAALLLTGRSVCVLRAQHVPVASGSASSTP